MQIKAEKILDLPNGGSIYATNSDDGFLPVNITKEDAIKELKKMQPTEKQNLALFILICWS